MEKEKSSYKQIIKSTSIFGGVQIANILLGIVRNKAIAVLLGAAGLGLIGIYQNIVDLIRAFSSLGIDTGGIRDIASSADDKKRLAHKIAVFKWWVFATACLGATICILLSYPISIVSFEDNSQVFPIILLSFSVFFSSLSLGQSVIMQGMRRISSMAKSTLWGNFVGLSISLPIYYFMGMNGIIPAFISGAVVIFFFTSFYSRKIEIPQAEIPHLMAFKEGISNLKLGLFVVSASVINMGSMFFIRTFLKENIDLEAVGIFQAVWAIAAVNLSLILKAMGTDFYPRLCTVSKSNEETKKLVNQQTYIALVAATPAIVTMILFSEIALSLLYSSKFVEGTSLLQWQIVGTFFKVLSWPMAFILLAKGKGKIYLFSEVVFFATYIGTSYFLFPFYGLMAVGIAYLASYVIYLLIILIAAYKLSKFRWNKQNLKVSCTCLLFIALSILSLSCLNGYLLTLVSLVIAALSVAYSLFMLNKVFNINDFLKNLKQRFLK